MRKVILLTAVLLASCQQSPEKQAKAALKSLMYDVESARFDGVQRLAAPAPRTGDLICGLVNGKNKVGAYVGFRRFLAYPAEGIAVVDPDEVSGQDQRDFNKMRREASGAGCRFMPSAS